VTIYDENSSLEDRVRDTGILTPETAATCAFGIVARRAASISIVEFTIHSAL